MRARSDAGILGQLAVLFKEGTQAGMNDAELVGAYRRNLGRGDNAQQAFSVLVARHGPMVFRTCQGILRDPHEANDAFQATFLILLRRAQGLCVTDSLGPWLHRVACRVAYRARQQIKRRVEVETRAGARRAIWVVDPATAADFEPILHAEINRLPESARRPLILCDLMGHSYDEAAVRLGCPVGTVKSRLSRAREKLRGRLERRGFAPAALAGGTWLPRPRPVPEALIASTVRLHLGVGGRLVQGGVGTVPARVVELLQGELRTMLPNNAKWAAATLMGLAVVGAGIVSQSARAQRESTAEQHAPSQVEAKAPSPSSATIEETAKTAPTKPSSEQESVAAFKRGLDSKRLENEAAAITLKSESDLKKLAVEAAVEEMKLELEAKKLAMEAETEEFDIMLAGNKKVARVAGELQSEALTAKRLAEIRMLELKALTKFLMESDFGFAVFAKEKPYSDAMVAGFEAAQEARKRIDEIISELSEADAQAYTANAMIEQLSEKYPQVFHKPAASPSESMVPSPSSSSVEQRLDAVEAKLDRLIEALKKGKESSAALDDRQTHPKR